MKASRYNFVTPTKDAWLVFNARTGAILRFAEDTTLRPLLLCLSGEDQGEAIEIDSDTLRLLMEHQFILDDDFDEIADVRKTYWSARRNAPVVLTITTTLDCNLGCFYCYEERSPERLESGDLPTILDRTRTMLARSDRGSLHVDWYGGEPTLNLPFIEIASSELQKICEGMGVRYSASVISNGTSWPHDIEAFVQRHRIRQVQITFDGMRSNHDRRRHFRHKEDVARSSFDEAAATVSRLLSVCRVDLRYNMDERNKNDFVEFSKFSQEQGWFSAKFRAILQPVRIAAYTERSRFVEKIGVSIREFEALKREVFGFLPEGIIEEPETIGGYAVPKTSVCAALSMNAIVVGADKRVYRCGLQVSEPHRAVGRLAQSPFKILSDTQDYSDEIWWDEFDPTLLSSCSSCSFLPICLGGCPKKQLEQDQSALDAQSIYWRENLPRLICKTASLPYVQHSFSEREQFRLAE